MSSARPVSVTVTITHAIGLHARPAVTFTRLAKTFGSAEIQIRGGDDQTWVDAKSIVKAMALKLRTGAVLQIRASGPDAGQAIDALKAMVERNFDVAGATCEAGAACETGETGTVDVVARDG